MARRDLESSRGISLIELTIGVGLLVMAIGGIFGWLQAGSRIATYGISRSMVNEDARWGVQQLTGSLMEASIDHVDTTLRVLGSATDPDAASDRFFYRGLVHVQCSSSQCRFHTRENLEQIRERLLCGLEYAELPSPGITLRGRIWPEGTGTCPLDGSLTAGTVALDGIKFFSLRSRGSDIPALDAVSGGPRWTGVTLVFPCPAGDGTLSLRRYDIYVEDLLAGAVTWSSDWTRFDPNDPSIVDLFDFGTDGTRDGVPDGRVPVTAALTDADSEVFMVQGLGPEAIVVVSKALDVTSQLTSRTLYLSVRLRDGFVQFSVDHTDESGATWNAANSFTCQQATLMTHLSEFAVSTARSCPHDPVANPLGVRLPDMVRITIGVTRAYRDQEITEWVNETSTIEVKCRN